MLTSHELMVASQKKRKDGNVATGHRQQDDQEQYGDFGEQQQPQNHFQQQQNPAPQPQQSGGGYGQRNFDNQNNNYGYRDNNQGYQNNNNYGYRDNNYGYRDNNNNNNNNYGYRDNNQGYRPNQGYNQGYHNNNPGPNPGYQGRYQNSYGRDEYHQTRNDGFGGGGYHQNFQRQTAPYTDPFDETKTYEGTVQNYYREKGYGFIRSDDFSAPLFFHYSEIQLEGFKYLIKQQKVEFTARVTEDGKLQAIMVVPTELAPTQQRKIFNRPQPDAEQQNTEQGIEQPGQDHEEF